MMKNICSLIALISICLANVQAQYKLKVGHHASIGVNPNIETYFFVEKLAVESIDYIVFDIKGLDYSHQPIVHFGFQHFQAYQKNPTVLKAASIIKEIRDTYHDNGPILEYLLNQKAFPEKGSRSGAKLSSTQKLEHLYAELTDSLRSFYIKANVGAFLKENKRFYKGALAEIAKDMNKKTYSAIEKWYGQQYPAYELYFSAAMPITAGEDSYRGFGPVIMSSKGKIPSMVMSSSKMLKLQPNLASYQEFGFNNAALTKFITVHEVSHSFVNHLLEPYDKQLTADSAFFIKPLKDSLAANGIRNWNVFVTENLVRLGEIRIALAMGNEHEAARLRKLHIKDDKCILIPLLEEQIINYENNRSRYPSFEKFLPELIKFLHELSPEVIDEQLHKYEDEFFLAP